MKDLIQLKSRYGYNHKLERVSNKKYKLNLDDTCNSFRLGSSEGKIDFIDPAGGPFMSVGGLCEEFVIDNIKIDNNEYYITFK